MTRYTRQIAKVYWKQRRGRDSAISGLPARVCCWQVQEFPPVRLYRLAPLVSVAIGVPQCDRAVETIRRARGPLFQADRGRRNGTASLGEVRERALDRRDLASIPFVGDLTVAACPHGGSFTMTIRDQPNFARHASYRPRSIPMLRLAERERAPIERWHAMSRFWSKFDGTLIDRPYYPPRNAKVGRIAGRVLRRRPS